MKTASTGGGATWEPPRYRLKRTNLLTYGVIACLCAVIGLVAWTRTLVSPVLQNLEGQVIDIQHRWRGVIPPQNREAAIALLFIDDKSVAEIGALPIDRRLVAQAVNKLHDDGARLIAFDMIFSDPARRDSEADDLLAKAIRRAGNVLLPYELGTGHSTDHDAKPPATPTFIINQSLTRYSNDQAASNMRLIPERILPPIGKLGEAAIALGHVSAVPGYDGSLRYDQPVLGYQDEFFPSLALVAASLVSHHDTTSLSVRFGDFIQFAKNRLPIDRYSRQIVHYYGPSGTFPTYSFTDYLHGRTPPAVFKDKLVLIGGAAIGASDRNPSPFDAALPGTERVATLIDNLISGQWLSRPPWASLIEQLAIVLLPFVAVYLVGRLRMSLSLPIILGLLVTVVVGSQWLFVSQRQVIGQSVPMLTVLLAAALAVSYRAWLDEMHRRRAEADLRASEQRYALAARGANDGLWDWDIVNGVVFFSERWQQLMAIEQQPLNTMADWYALLEQTEAERFIQQIDAHLQGQTSKLYHVIAYTQSNQTNWLLVRGVAVVENGQATRMAGSITDITEQKNLQKQIQTDALYDRLTGLANYYPFQERLRAMFRQSQALYGATKIGLVVFDINHFRQLNERHSRIFGNDVLRETAQRLVERFKDLLLGRTSGDQFMVAYSGDDDPTIAEAVAAVFSIPMVIDHIEEHISATIATVHTTQGIETVDELLNAATLTVALAKQRRRGKITAYNPDDRAVEKNRQWLSDNIAAALAAGDQFKLFYQPFVRLSDRKLLGFESLIRWHHPERGFIGPDTFIPFAEECGQINEIGHWVMQQAVADLKTWSKLGFSGEIAINLSSRQFADQDLPALFGKVKRELPSEIAVERLKLEVTESMSMANPQHATDVLSALTSMGYKISIDDFGTGYSSLAYLHRFPFHTLKIDQSFVRRLDTTREVKEIVRTITLLGKNLGKVILAEGIETEEAAMTLADIGVDVGQGWLFAKALPFDEASRFIENHPHGQA